DYVLPEDIQAVLGPVVDHRLQSLDSGDQGPPGERLRTEVPLP
ncbi:MAG: AAA family ATPase, partial [Halofilum sp. (in: g-proteobacteria)]